MHVYKYKFVKHKKLLMQFGNHKKAKSGWEAAKVLTVRKVHSCFPFKLQNKICCGSVDTNIIIFFNVPFSVIFSRTIRSSASDVCMQSAPTCPAEEAAPQPHRSCCGHRSELSQPLSCRAWCIGWLAASSFQDACSHKTAYEALKKCVKIRAPVTKQYPVSCRSSSVLELRDSNKEWAHVFLQHRFLSKASSVPVLFV